MSLAIKLLKNVNTFLQALLMENKYAIQLRRKGK